MSEFTNDTLIHLVIPSKQWDEMWELYNTKNKVNKGKPGETKSYAACGYENTLWYKIQTSK